MAVQEPIDIDLGSIFEDAGAGPEASPASLLRALVEEFTPLDRRRLRSGGSFSAAEDERWHVLREHLEYAFGSAPAPLGGSRRQLLRVPTRMKVQCSVAGSDTASLCNLSQRGAYVELSAPLPETGTSVQLGIEPAPGEAPLRLEATVRWGREIGNMDGPSGIGVEFVGVEGDDFEALERLLAGTLAARIHDGA